MNAEPLLSNIDFLHSDRYQATLEKAEDGKIGLTHKAEIIWPDGVNRDSWVKIYRKQFSRGLVNEVIGYILAGTLDLPQPEHAGFLMYPTDWIDENHKNELSEIDLYRGYTIAWVTSDTQGMNLRIKLENLESKPEELIRLYNLFKEDIKNWEKLPDLIAFDYAIHNEDRNLGNLLQLPNKKFCLIDHGEILTSSNWGYWELLSPKNNGWNMMNHYIQYFNEKFIDEGIFKDLATHNYLTSCYQNLPSNFKSSQAELLSHLKQMLNGESFNPPAPLPKVFVTDSIINFIEERSENKQNFSEECARLLGIPTDSLHS